jgi:hypothetical protein
MKCTVYTEKEERKKIFSKHEFIIMFKHQQHLAEEFA